MSRSEQQLTSPVGKRFTWRGGEGKVVYYDKEAGEEKEVKTPFDFIVLDELATIGGWSDEDKSSYWSNEVRSVNNEPFTVKTSKGVVETGLYNDLASRSKGAKYAKSVYILYDGGIHNLKLQGAALSSWINFTQDNNVMSGKVSLKGKSDPQKKGATTYYYPEFVFQSVTEAEEKEAQEADRELQSYLGQRLTAGKFNRNQNEDVEGADEGVNEGAGEETVIDDIDDEPVDLNDIPF